MPTIELVPGNPALLLGGFPVSDLGYTVAEYVLSGTATSYEPVAPLGPDGDWNVVPSATAAYTTRVVALQPENPAAFNGTILVEWLNVSGGIDAPAVWFTAHREITRAGYGYVAVSAQYVGVEGGPSLTGLDMSLKSRDPQRYGKLSHPGDAFSFDIFSAAGRILRENPSAAGFSAADRLIAVGESQSAMFLTTYINAPDPLAAVYDGFLVHSRFGPAAPLDGTSILTEHGVTGVPTRFRPHLRVPVCNVLTETDLIGGRLPGYHLARQPDDTLLRTWEIAGAAHADNYTIAVSFIDNGTATPAELAAAYTPTDQLMGKQLDHYINFGPQHHYVVQAALAGLHDWVHTGSAMASAPRLELTETDPPELVLDPDGAATGGIRTPWIEVPTAVTSGTGSDETELSFIFGSGRPFDAGELRRRYPGGRDEYLRKFAVALDSAIGAGHLCAADRPEILAVADAAYPGAV